MADIFISYKRENKNQAALLAEKLEASGFTVWWDHDLLGGDDFDVVISKQIAEAKAVIVIWSAESIHSRYVKDEASKALKRNILVPVTFDNTEPPIGFGMTHTLVFENGERINGQEWNKLNNSIRKKTGGTEYVIKDKGKNEKDLKQNIQQDGFEEIPGFDERKKNKVLPFVFSAAVLAIIIFFVVKSSGKNSSGVSNMSTDTAAAAVEVPTEELEAITRRTPTEEEDVAAIFGNRPLEASLPGDTITQYTIKEITNKSITLTVEYSYNARHNNGVYLGAWLFRSAEAGGYPPVMLSSPAGSSDITITLPEIKNSFTSEGILVFMGESYKSPFTYRVFNYRHAWKVE